MYTSRVLKLENVNKGELNEFLLAGESSLLFTSPPYLELLKSFLKCEIEIIEVRKDNNIVGVLPLAFKKDPDYGCVCNSLPFYGSNGGMIVQNLEDKNVIRTLLLKEFDFIIKERKCIASTIISNPLDYETNDWLKQNLMYNSTDERIGQITHFLNLHEEDFEQRLMSSFDDPRPRNIRKAQKEGVKIFASNSREDIDFLYQTHYDNITAINGIPKEKIFFDMIPDYFDAQEYKIYIAELNGEKIAALLLFYYNKTVEYFTPAVVEKFRNQQPSALIIYQAMLDSIKKGFKNWNWGGTWISQGGVYDFKKKWATTDHMYFYYTNIIDDTVYELKKETLLKHFPYFYVIPFSALRNDK